MEKFTKRYLIVFLFVISFPSLVSCSSEEKIIGIWEDIHNPNNMVEFTKEHEFSQILFGQTIICPIQGCLPNQKNYEFLGEEINGY